MNLWPVVRHVITSPKATAPLPWLDSTLPPEPAPVVELVGSNWQLPFLHVCGSDYEMGWQQGVAWKALLHEFADRFYNQLACGVGYWLFRHILPPRLYHLWTFVPQNLQAEMQGLAAGAELPLTDVLLINFFDDVLNLMELGWATACSTTAVRTDRDRVVVGRNLDYYGPVGQIARPFQVAVRRSPAAPDRHTSLTVGMVGHVGVLTGLNTAGLSLGTMTAMTREQTWHGLGVSLIYRDILDRCPTVPAALEHFHRYQPVQGNSLLLADTTTAARVQFTSQRSRITHLAEEPLIGTNHFLDIELAASRSALHDRTLARGSHQRYSRLCQLVRTGTTIADLLASLSDVPQAEASEPSTANPMATDRWLTMSAVNSRGTLHSAILEPSDCSIRLALGTGERPICPDDYRHWYPFATDWSTRSPELDCCIENGIQNDASAENNISLMM
ncbi:MAG: C45 family peptidase [Cyanobacteria bacterium P01_D01_bin.123]